MNNDFKAKIVMELASGNLEQEITDLEFQLLLTGVREKPSRPYNAIVKAFWNNGTQTEENEFQDYYDFLQTISAYESILNQQIVIAKNISLIRYEIIRTY